MSWILPALKAILPHVGTIIETAKPVLTRKSGGAKPATEEQIAELQAAVTQNADHIQALAEQLRRTVTVLEEEAEATRGKLRRAYLWCGVSMALSLAAAVIALAAWFTR
jgi:hypothetical protein